MVKILEWVGVNVQRGSKIIYQLKYENLTYIVITLLLFCSVLQASLLGYVNSSLLSLIYLISLILRLALVLFWILSNPRYSKKDIAGSFVLFILIITSYISIGSLTLFDLFFVAMTYKKLEYEKTINCFIMGILFGFITVLLLYYIGGLPSFSIFRNETGFARNSFGFSHPNVAGRMVLYLCMLWILKRKKEVRVIELIIMSVAAYWVYVYPNSITASLMIILLIVVVLISKCYKYLFNRDFVTSAIVRWGSMILIPSVFIVTFYLVANSGNHSVIAYISETFYSRFWGGLAAIQQYPINLFGNKIRMIGAAERYFGGNSQSYFTIDCLYVLLPVRYGIITTLYVAYRIFDAIKITLRFKQTYLLIVLIVMLIYSFAENGLTLFYSSFVFICASCIKNRGGE